MLGVLNRKCQWQKRESVNIYNESTYAPPVELDCAIAKEPKITQTEAGLMTTSSTYYILHTPITDGDLIDGKIAKCEEIRTLFGDIAWYKVVFVQ